MIRCLVMLDLEESRFVSELADCLFASVYFMAWYDYTYKKGY